jgi:hypothetical protein
MRGAHAGRVAWPGPGVCFSAKPEKNLSTLFGRVALTRSGGTATLDFYSLSKKICPELLFEVSKLEGVLRVAGSGSSADEKIAPISLDVRNEAVRQMERSRG